MSRRRENLAQRRYHRPLLSEVLPYEVPPMFTNGGFFSFCARLNLRLIRQKKKIIVTLENANADDLTAVGVLLGLESGDILEKCVRATRKARKVCGNDKSVSQISWKFTIEAEKNFTKINTRPFDFSVAHREGKLRSLAVPHPRNQLEICEFYDRYHQEITTTCERSKFSIRRPTRRASTAFIKRGFTQKIEQSAHQYREEDDKNYEFLGSYFSYYKYSNVYRFYDSYLYQNSEREFNYLIRQDIQKCFDSIYTHTIAWATHTKDAIKDNLIDIDYIFSSKFDAIQRSLNYNETNGIIIGPEFSRIFAEMILQDVDVDLERKLTEFHNLLYGRDYRIFRYVDDFFIFCNSLNDGEAISASLQSSLREKKMNLSDGKKQILSKPLITSLTKAKERMLGMFSVLVEDVEVGHKIGGYSILYSKANPNKIIKNIKTIVSDCDVTYSDTLNYFLTIINDELSRKCERFSINASQLQKANLGASIAYAEMKRFLLNMLEPLFFVALSEPKVNFTIKICRTICNVVDFMQSAHFPTTHRGDVVKYIDDNIRIALNKISKVKTSHIEVLYFILAQGKLGRYVALNEKYLEEILFSKWGSESADALEFFKIIVTLTYIRKRKKYGKLNLICYERIINMINKLKPYSDVDSLFTIMVIDFLCCPYLSEEQKKVIAVSAGYTDDLSIKIQSASKTWFTDWVNFDLSRALDRKRVREVY